MTLERPIVTKLQKQNSQQRESLIVGIWCVFEMGMEECLLVKQPLAIGRDRNTDRCGHRTLVEPGRCVQS